VIETWRELEPGVLVRRHRELDLNVGLVVGARRAVVIDTRGAPPHARDLLAAAQSVTRLPLTVVITHAHYDHFLGNSVFADAGSTEFWAHRRCAAAIIRDGGRQQELAAAALTSFGGPDQLRAAQAEIRSCRIVPPNRVVDDAPVEIDLGGVKLELAHLGAGHTDGDLVVRCGGTVFAGDLVEEGAPPSFEDSYPLQWPHTVRRMVDQAARRGVERIVPGHGDVIRPEQASQQADEIEAAADLIAAAWRRGEADAAAQANPVRFGDSILADDELRALIRRTERALAQQPDA
jgi:glyoxylase-like metal-dependent hydrolase (beta-lactamase superfamily II)